MKTYLRPIALTHGEDAARAIAEGWGASLGGLPQIAFSKVELITRRPEKITREIVNLDQARNHPSYVAITAPRPNFGPLPLSQCHVMGILNATPDSFSDGGVHHDPAVAIAEGEKMIEDGASLLDIGGESTRPGSETVETQEEGNRILPIIKALAKNHVVSVDTRKSSLMVQGLAKGAAIINDVSSLQFDPESANVVAKANAPVILMHAQGEPRTMQLAPKYDDVTLDVYDQLQDLITKAEQAGIARNNIMVDPGIGFGKNFKQNLELLQQLSIFHGLGVCLLIGLSRKGFIGALTHEKTASKRLGGSLGGAIHATMQGAHVLRVHDVKETVTMLSVWYAASAPISTLI